jgi:ankyrin repeat protein
LIRSGANINAKNEYNQTPLHLACKYGKYDIVQKLLETGANHQALNGNGQKPIDLIDDNNCQLTMLVLFYMNVSYGSQNFNF